MRAKNKKQSMNDLKLRRLNELNSRLREDLERDDQKAPRESWQIDVDFECYGSSSQRDEIDKRLERR